MAICFHVLIGQLGGDQPSTINLRATGEKRKGFCHYIFTKKVTLWGASYRACVVYTKTVVHLTVGESGGYLPCRFAVIKRSLTPNVLATRISLLQG